MRADLKYAADTSGAAEIEAKVRRDGVERMRKCCTILQITEPHIVHVFERKLAPPSGVSIRKLI